jgi:hypothetical protein
MEYDVICTSLLTGIADTAQPNWTEDFVLLPTVKGKGRFLGTNIGLNSNSSLRNLLVG